MRVAIVEDNPDGRQSLADLLAVLGYEVVALASAHEALALGPAEEPDVFVVDIGLPDMNGYELARRLRERAGRSDTLLVALTGYGSPEDRLRAEHAGFDHHPTKPVDVGALERLLARPNDAKIVLGAEGETPDQSIPAGTARNRTSNSTS